MSLILKTFGMADLVSSATLLSHPSPCSNTLILMLLLSRVMMIGTPGTKLDFCVFVLPLGLSVIQSLQWRHNGHDVVSNHQPHHCLLNRLFRHRSKNTLKLHVTCLCVGNSPGTGKFPAQMASNAENVSIWWRHHGWSAISNALVW